ncbi:helix-turn-helix domain-containing protein [Paenibacillus arenilitoris]|uniref:Helix-turn-helix transcriptional regulator n=1 Tax=Paenibacillus arenilitoris TaxID=2772299 RepID=A0A927H490_9BACL|nr:AraC family transcriptional regulator [Paenibacillus arenilitoris]MBD2867228.1 helix-turn-helix transcriptional regulator [Paenibacillus arenilitoris]
MTALDPSLTPQAQSVIYWKQIDAFQLPEDKYDTWVLFAVTEGRFRYAIAGQTGEAGFGDLVLCPPRTTFAREVVEPLTFHFYRFDWIGGDGKSGLPDAVRLTIRDHARLVSNYVYLNRLGSRPDGAARHPLAAHILRDLWQLCCLEETPLAADARTPAKEDADAMGKAARIIRREACGKLVMKELAASLGLSPVQFTRKFQSVFGQSPIDYLTELRIREAQTLLLETRLTLDQIAERCGYDSGFYLSRIFAKRMRVSPAAYRKANRI